jgi:hypothetical protein
MFFKLLEELLQLNENLIAVNNNNNRQENWKDANNV